MCKNILIKPRFIHIRSRCFKVESSSILHCIYWRCIYAYYIYLASIWAWNLIFRTRTRNIYILTTLVSNKEVFNVIWWIYTFCYKFNLSIVWSSKLINVLNWIRCCQAVYWSTTCNNGNFHERCRNWVLEAVFTTNT